MWNAIRHQRMSRKHFFPVQHWRCRSFKPALESLESRALPSTFTVIDLGDNNSGSGLEGDLRYCLTQANGNMELSNRIVFEPGLSGTITLSGHELSITKNVEIDGPGAESLTISGNLQSGVLNITSDPAVQDVRIADVTVADGIGILNTFGTARFGGGLLNDHATVTLTRDVFADNALPGLVDAGGAIENGRHGTMVLNSCSFIGNSSGPRGEAGAIANFGTMTLTDCTISGNRASVQAAIHNNGAMSLSRCTITNNVATDASSGDMILADGFLPLIISDSTISDNVGASPALYVNSTQMIVTNSTIANNMGGAFNSFDGYLSVSNSTISGNTAGVNGWAAAVHALSVIGSETILTNCTITGNVSPNHGAIEAFSTAESMEITGCTITDNVGGLSGGLFVATTSRQAARVIVRSSIIADNQGTDAGTGDVWGSALSLGYNLIGRIDNSTGWVSTDRTGTIDQPLEPQLGPLEDNGGETLTRALFAGSPAIRAGDPALAGTNDQRGTPRSFFTTPDIGAFQTSMPLAFAIIAPSIVVAGVPFEVTVIAVDGFGNRASTSTQSIHFSSTDLSADLPDDYTFVRDDLGAHSFTITLGTRGIQTVRVNDVQTPFFNTAVSIDVQEGFRPSHRRAAEIRPSLAFTPISAAREIVGNDIYLGSDTPTQQRNDSMAAIMEWSMIDAAAETASNAKPIA